MFRGDLLSTSRNFEALLQGETGVFVMQPEFNTESNFWYEDVLLPYVFLLRVSLGSHGSRHRRFAWITDPQTFAELKKFEVNFHQLPCLRARSGEMRRKMRGINCWEKPRKRLIDLTNFAFSIIRFMKSSLVRSHFYRGVRMQID